MTMDLRITPRSYNSSLMRGYISRTTTEWDDYAIEISNDAHCDMLMASVAAHTDEILELLSTSDSHIAKMLAKSIYSLEKTTRENYEKCYEEISNRE